MTTYTFSKETLNQAIAKFPQVTPITEDMHTTFDGISRMVMLDRYAFKDITKETLTPGDVVVLTTKPDPDFPARGIGIVQGISNSKVKILVDEAYRGTLTDPNEQETGLVERPIEEIDKPLELFYEQIAHRVAKGLAKVEKEEHRKAAEEQFYDILSKQYFVPAGRVLYGSGSDSNATYFNCYVMPFIQDSRGGIAKHREKVMEIMSRGGGVGTNGSTLRPHYTLARGVNGVSSGAVSWLNDIAQLTHLVQQGGSRRGAQMIMLADWHPDVLEFIIAKMQNPTILRFIIENFDDPQIQQLAQNKLKFTPLSFDEQQTLEQIVSLGEDNGFSAQAVDQAKKRLKDGGDYSVENMDFLTGANISIAITDDFMDAVKHNQSWTLRYPDVEHYDEAEMEAYNTTWQEVGDVREWEKLGHDIRNYREIPARTLWKLINLCATYSAEPGVFFIDNANKMTNAVSYGQKVVATNPCGEQPLSAWSVCNLGAINLAHMVNKDTHEVDYDKLRRVVQIAVRMQDDVIDATPYFLEENKKQAKGERRVGLGVMGLADLLIYAQKVYGSKEGNDVVDKVFETIAKTAYKTSVELAKVRGSFPFLEGQDEQETLKRREAFIHSGYMERMPESLKEDILTYGIRNSHLLTVAPTGSTGTMMGVSTGLEPYFAFKYFRSGRLGKFIEVNAAIVQEYLNEHPDQTFETLPDFFISAMELAPEAHVDVQTTIQYWVDSSISKTVNAPRGYSVEQVASIYRRLYEGGAKGGTVYVDGSRDTQVLNLSNDEESTSNEFDGTSLTSDISESEEARIEEASDVTYGSDLGDTCPICREGIVEDLGGCNTCTNCGVQLRCGL